VAIIAHDLPVATRKAIRQMTSSPLEFIELSFLGHHSIPSFLDRSRIKDKLICGYDDDTITDRLVNRRLAYEGMKQLRNDFDWYWRLAPDATLTANITYDPFVRMASQGKRYGYMTTVEEDRRCISGLWDAAKSYVDRTQIQPTFFNVVPEGTVFYNGFEISHRTLWEGQEYQKFFDFMDHKGGMLYHRWTDMNIRTLALSLFTPSDEIHRFTDVGFHHWPFVDQHTDRNVIKKTVQPLWESRAVTVTPAEDLNSLFAARRWGFQGADVATSFRLPSVASHLGAYAWLLGDTFLGTSNGLQRLSDGVHTIHNSLAFLPKGDKPIPADVHFFYNYKADGMPTEVFGYPTSDGIYWPVAGLSVELKQDDGSVESKIILLAQRVVKKHGT